MLQALRCTRNLVDVDQMEIGGIQLKPVNRAAGTGQEAETELNIARTRTKT
jgi:hypothetical protein